MAEPSLRPDAPAPRPPLEERGAARTLLVALSVCAVCSAVVTASVVLLRPYQLAHQRAEREAKVRALVEGLPGIAELLATAGGAPLEVRVVELATGAYAPSIDPESLVRPAGPPREGVPLPPERDPAGIGLLPRYAPVYELRRGGAVDSVILPVYGQGYITTIRGYLALAGDGNTVRGITFTEQQETPGLGAEIASPAWTARWRGKRLRDAAGEVRIRVVQEALPAGEPHRVEGISGATRTGDGVSALVRFWVGPDGFGPYLARIRAEHAGEGGTSP